MTIELPKISSYIEKILNIRMSNDFKTNLGYVKVVLSQVQRYILKDEGFLNIYQVMEMKN